MENLLEYQRIKAWAESKKPGDVIGRACTNTQCPIANYLHEQTDKLWSVGPSIKPMDGTKNRLAAPIWIRELIACIDRDAHIHDANPVIREDFLRYLDEIKPR